MLMMAGFSDIVLVTSMARPGAAGPDYKVRLVALTDAGMNFVRATIGSTLLTLLLRQGNHKLPENWAGFMSEPSKSVALPDDLEAIVLTSASFGGNADHSHAGFELHKLELSPSEDSDFSYFGRNVAHGGLLQYGNPTMIRTEDRTPHSGIHYHIESSERFCVLYGLLDSWTVKVDENGMLMRETLAKTTVGVRNGFPRTLVVPPYTAHVVVPRMPVITSIFTNPPYNGRGDHNPVLSKDSQPLRVREALPELFAHYAQGESGILVPRKS